jgi:hypothetical protein
MERFKAMLTEQLNAPTWKLSEGRVVDPRPLTVFLIESPPKVSASSLLAASSSSSAITPQADSERSACIEWVLGPPPIEGREQRARSMVADELEQVLIDRRKRNLIIGRRADALQPLLLNDTQNDILSQLMAFDMQLALDARTSNLSLSPIPLVRGNMCLRARKRLPHFPLSPRKICYRLLEQP